MKKNTLFLLLLVSFLFVFAENNTNEKKLCQSYGKYIYLPDGTVVLECPAEYGSLICLYYCNPD